MQIIGTVGAKLLLTKAREEEIKRPVLFHTCKGQKEGVKRSGRWCWWRKGHEEEKKKKKEPLKMNHGKVINKGRTARVGCSTFSFSLERNKTLQLAARSGEWGHSKTKREQCHQKDRNRISDRQQIGLGWLGITWRWEQKAGLKAYGIAVAGQPKGSPANLTAGMKQKP